jgi:tyrosine-protein phosphatase SIW14
MPISNFGIVNDSIFRSGQPSDQKAIADLYAIGCRAILKLNSDTEYEAETEWCHATNMAIIQMPIPTLVNSTETIKTIAEKLLETGLRMPHATRVLVHCTHGRDRTGLVVAAYRIMFEKWTVEQANAERKRYGVLGFIELADIDMEVILREIYGQVHQGVSK